MGTTFWRCCQVPKWHYYHYLLWMHFTNETERERGIEFATSDLPRNWNVRDFFSAWVPFLEKMSRSLICPMYRTVCSKTSMHRTIIHSKVLSRLTEYMFYSGFTLRRRTPCVRQTDIPTNQTFLSSPRNSSCRIVKALRRRCSIGIVKALLTYRYSSAFWNHPPFYRIAYLYHGKFYTWHLCHECPKFTPISTFDRGNQ